MLRVNWPNNNSFSSLSFIDYFFYLILISWILLCDLCFSFELVISSKLFLFYFIRIKIIERLKYENILKRNINVEYSLFFRLIDRRVILRSVYMILILLLFKKKCRNNIKTKRLSFITNFACNITMTYKRKLPGTMTKVCNNSSLWQKKKKKT